MKILLKLLQQTGLLLFTGCFFIVAPAQDFGNSSPVTNPFSAQYFTDRYLANPAMAGSDTALNLNAVYRQQFSGMPGAPVSEAFTADYNPGKRVGLGLTTFNNTAGLISRTRFALTYAYHLPIGQEGEQLHFGISGAFAHNQINPKGIVGEQNDPAIAEFNARKNTFEADYGMAYTDPHITLQLSLINLIGYFQHVNTTTSDVSTLYGAFSYKIFFNGAVNSIEPEVAFQGVKELNSVLNAGANLVMVHHILNFFVIGNTLGGVSGGVGITYRNKLHIEGSYLSQTSGLRNYTNGTYEVGISLAITGKSRMR